MDSELNRDTIISLKEKGMTRDDLIDSMEIIIKENEVEKAAEYIYRLWMNHNDYEIKKGKVVHITKGLDISQKLPRDS